MNPEDILYNNRLYKMIDTKFDIIGQRYEMKVRCFWMLYYSRKQSAQYSTMYNDLNIFISLETPLISKYPKASNEYVCGKLIENWKFIFEYAVERKNIEWISYTQGDRHVLNPNEKTYVMNYLELDESHFDLIYKQSPYS